MKSRDDQAAQLLLDVAGEDRRLSNENARDERAEDRVDAYRLRDEGHHSCYDDDHRDDRQLTHEAVVRPANEEEDDTPAMVKLRTRNRPVPTHSARDAHDVDPAMQRQTEDHRHDDPTHRVIDDRGGDDDLADRTPQKTQLADQQGHDLTEEMERAGTEKQRRDQPLVRIGKQ